MKPSSHAKQRCMSLVAIVIFVVMISTIMSCSTPSIGIEVPQLIQQRIYDTENTYMIKVQYLVWDDITMGYRWEYYTDYRYEL